MEGSNQLTPQTISHPAKKVNRRSHLRRRTRARCECQSIGSKFRSSVSSNKFFVYRPNSRSNRQEISHFKIEVRLQPAFKRYGIFARKLAYLAVLNQASSNWRGVVRWIHLILLNLVQQCPIAHLQ